LNALIPAAIGAILVMGLFLVLARVSGGSSNMKGRLERFVGDGPKDTEEKASEDKKKFSLGIGKSQLAAQVDKRFGRQTFGRSIQRKLAQADLKLTLLEYMIGKVAGMLVGLALGVFLGRGGAVQLVIFGFVGVLAGFFAPDVFVRMRISKRMKAFNGQLGDTISLLANSLRSGYSLLQSMELVAKESPDPIGTEFKRVVREVGLGISPQEALQNLFARMPSEDLDLLITAINIQYEVGGNLAQILDTISHTIRERVRIKGEINVLTTQGKVSGYLVTALPFLIAIVVTLINPEYMNTLWVFPWIIMPICGFILVVTGFLVIRKIINIEV